MNVSSKWWIVGLLALTIGCSKSEPAGSSAAGGTKSLPPAKVAAEPAADVYVQGMVDAIAAGDAATLWNALPTKYQADVATVKNEFAAKVDPEVWNTGFAVGSKLTKVLKEKKAMLMASPLSSFLPPGSKEPIDKNWESVVGLLNTLTSSEIKTVDGLKSADPGKYVSSVGSALLAGGLKTAEAADPRAAAEIAKTRKSKVILVKQEGNTATLKMEVDGEMKPEKEFKKVDGKWLPADMVAEWDEKIADIKADMPAVVMPPEQKLMVMGLLTQFDGVLDQLLTAKDQGEFDGAIGMAMMQIGPMMMGPGGGGMSGPPPGMSGPPPGGSTAPSLTAPVITPPAVTPPKIEPPKTEPKPNP